MKSNLDLYSLNQAYNLESKDIKKLYEEYSNILNVLIKEITNENLHRQC